MMTIKPIPSELSQTEFLNLFGGVFEKSSWIAENLYLLGIKNEYNNLWRRSGRLFNS